MGELIPFVPRHKRSRRPMLEQMAHEILAQVTKPKDEETAPCEMIPGHVDDDEPA